MHDTPLRPYHFRGQLLHIIHLGKENVLESVIQAARFHMEEPDLQYWFSHTVPAPVHRVMRFATRFTYPQIMEQKESCSKLLNSINSSTVFKTPRYAFNANPST